MSQENIDFITENVYANFQSGTSYETLVAHIWTVQDGRIVQFDELYDSCAVAEAFKA